MSDLKRRKEYNWSPREDIIELIPLGNHRVLDVGCGTGTTLKTLKMLGKASEIFGIEINEDTASSLTDELDDFYIGDIEASDLPFDSKYFDYVIFGDVLEHLVDPGAVLKNYSKLLKDDGYVIASIPNIKYHTVVLRLILFDEFKYSESGLLDDSHLRFFTKKEIIRLFDSENLEILQIVPCLGFDLWKPLRMLDKTSSHALTNVLRRNSFLVSRYIVKAKKRYELP